MAHQINRMVYVGEMPWHGLGVRLPARASYEEIAGMAVAQKFLRHSDVREGISRSFTKAGTAPGLQDARPVPVEAPSKGNGTAADGVEASVPPNDS